jgi:hypothetical protein
MKLKCKLDADIVGLIIKRNKTNDGREAFVDIDIVVKREGAEKRWGDDFVALAFATLQVRADPDADGEDGQSYSFLVDSLKPNNRLVFERHRIELEEEAIEVQPELTGIRTVDGAAQVIARLRLPIDVGRKKLLSNLASKVGVTVKLEFSPQQASFEFKRGKEPEEKPTTGEKAKDSPQLEVVQ